MIKVRCHTNLDLNGESWPCELPAVPRVGDEIESTIEHNHGFHLTLQVVKVTWRYDYGWTPHIELHMTEFQKRLPYSKDGKDLTGSIYAFYSWYAPLVGTTMGAFV